MHELSVCLSLMEQVEQIAREHGASSVTRIVLSVGPLSGVEPPLMQNAFPIAAAGTVADDATLLLETTDVRIQCNQCGQESDAEVNHLVCRHCGDWQTTLVSGNELILQRVVMEEAHV